MISLGSAFIKSISAMDGTTVHMVKTSNNVEFHEIALHPLPAIRPVSPLMDANSALVGLDIFWDLTKQAAWILMSVSSHTIQFVHKNVLTLQGALSASVPQAIYYDQI